MCFAFLAAYRVFAVLGVWYNHGPSEFEAATAQVCRAHRAGQDRPARSREGVGAVGWRARPLALCGNDLSRALGGAGPGGVTAGWLPWLWGCC